MFVLANWRYKHIWDYFFLFKRDHWRQISRNSLDNHWLYWALSSFTAFFASLRLSEPVLHGKSCGSFLRKKGTVLALQVVAIEIKGLDICCRIETLPHLKVQCDENCARPAFLETTAYFLCCYFGYFLGIQLVVISSSLLAEHVCCNEQKINPAAFTWRRWDDQHSARRHGKLACSSWLYKIKK